MKAQITTILVITSILCCHPSLAGEQEFDSIEHCQASTSYRLWQAGDMANLGADMIASGKRAIARDDEIAKTSGVSDLALRRKGGDQIFSGQNLVDRWWPIYKKYGGGANLPSDIPKSEDPCAVGKLKLKPMANPAQPEASPAPDSTRNTDAIFSRANAHLLANRHQEAIQDYNEILRITPGKPSVLFNRGIAYENAGDFDKAVADFTEVVQRKNDPQALIHRGRDYYYLREFNQAAADFRRALSLGAKDVYVAIWLHLAEKRTGTTSQHLTQYASSMSAAKWPYPIVKYLQNEISQEALLREASNGPEADRSNQLCEAYAYSGEFEFIGRNFSLAAYGLKKAAEICPKDYVEFMLTQETLKHLAREVAK